MKKILIITAALCIGLALRAQESDSGKTRIAQASFIYPIGSNGLDAQEYTNNFSFNVLAGYNGGVTGFELAGIFNMLRNDMQGCQIAGIGNTVLGNTTGAQIGGIFNVNRKNLHGLQIAGITNYSSKSSMTAQIAGINNMLRDTVKGTQIAGIGNYSTGVDYGMQMAGIANVSHGQLLGSQIAGISNINSSNSTGFQLAGISNLSGGSMMGSQIAGIANVAASKTSGFQLAGIANVSAGRMLGVQIAGITNVAKSLSGYQLGLINYVDSLESGAPIGFISVVRKNGYHKLEISGNESMYGSISLKTGAPRFYNIFSIGARTNASDIIWAYGYGVGTLFPISDRMDFNIDLVSYHMNYREWWTNHLNMLNKLSFGTNYQINKHIGIFAAASLNVHIADRFDYEGAPIEQTPIPFSIKEIKTNNTLINIYPGISFGIRI